MSRVDQRSRSAFRWLFEDRNTGAIAIFQAPNMPLVLFVAAAAVRAVFHPHGTVAGVVSVVATGALVWWSLGELIAGVNPFRRLLGAAVLPVVVAGLVAH